MASLQLWHQNADALERPAVLAPGEELARHMAYRGIITREVHQAIAESTRVARQRAGRGQPDDEDTDDDTPRAIAALARAAKHVAEAVRAAVQTIRYKAEHITQQWAEDNQSGVREQATSTQGAGNDEDPPACMGPACVKASSTLANAVTQKGTCRKCKAMDARGKKLDMAARAIANSETALAVLAVALHHRAQKGWVDSGTVIDKLQACLPTPYRGWGTGLMQDLLGAYG